jgi:D-glycero-D-manno-heptose 1,7-bisphosphate phosphatase
MKACVFFDRDGIVNESPGTGYVERWEAFRLMPGFVDLLRVVNAKGYAAIVVTNQQGVGRGIMSLQAVERIHRTLRELLLSRYGLSLLDVYCCPHLEGTCDCRKPRPGMLLKAAVDHDIDLGKSWMVGDAERDVQAGREAGCTTVLVGNGVMESAADFRVENLAAVRDLLADRL